MFQVPLSDIITKIKDKSGKDDKEIAQLIKSKQETLSGLITEQGAAQIVASELGINIYEEYMGSVRVDKVVPGMRGLEINVKIVRMYPVKSFTTKDGREGKVASLLLGDETGVIRLALWNDLTELASHLKEGDILGLTNASSKENQGKSELVVYGKESITINPEGVSVEVVPYERAEYKRVSISEIVGDVENVEILGNIVSVFDPRFFPSKLDNNPDGTPKTSAVINMVVDDGTGSIRTSLFENQINNLIKFTGKDILAYEQGGFSEVKDELLGEYVKLSGKAKLNERFDTIEFRAQLVVLKPDPKEEKERLDKANSLSE